LLQGDFLNEKKVSKIDSIKNHQNNSEIDCLSVGFGNNSSNFNVEIIEICEEQVEFIKNSLMNHFIFKDMSDDIM